MLSLKQLWDYVVVWAGNLTEEKYHVYEKIQSNMFIMITQQSTLLYEVSQSLLTWWEAIPVARTRDLLEALPPRRVCPQPPGSAGARNSIQRGRQTLQQCSTLLALHQRWFCKDTHVQWACAFRLISVSTYWEDHLCDLTKVRVLFLRPVHSILPCHLPSNSKKVKIQLRGFSPQANYTDLATAACWRS
jgi:hypothetical protein